MKLAARAFPRGIGRTDSRFDPRGEVFLSRPGVDPKHLFQKGD